MPPNSPSCTAGDATTAAISGWQLASVSSEHSGGVNVGLLDGSVKFISETINCGSITTYHDYPISGVSEYGVWGALGSCNGGETVTF